jgi:hypothetical protein
MRLSDHGLCQIDYEYVRSLGTDALRELSLPLPADLKDARGWLNQGQTNSPRRPGALGTRSGTRPDRDPETPLIKADPAPCWIP